MPHFRQHQIILCMCAAFLLQGCSSGDVRYILNSDGKGRAQFTFEAPIPFYRIDSYETLSDEELYRQGAEKWQDRIKGVDVWERFDWKQTDNGRLRITGQFLFTQLNKVRLPHQVWRWDLAKQGDGLVIKHLVNKDNPRPLQASKERDALYRRQLEKSVHTWARNLHRHVTFDMDAEQIDVALFTSTEEGKLAIALNGEELRRAFENSSQIAIRPDWSDGDRSPNEDSIKQINEIVYGEAVLAHLHAHTVKDRFDYDTARLAVVPPTTQSPTILPSAESIKLSPPVLQSLQISYDQRKPHALLIAEMTSPYVPTTVERAVEISVCDFADGSMLKPEHIKISAKRHWRHKDRIQLSAHFPVSDGLLSGIKKLAGHVTFDIAMGTVEQDLGVSPAFPGVDIGPLVHRLEKVKAYRPKPDKVNLRMIIKGNGRLFKELRAIAPDSSVITRITHCKNIPEHQQFSCAVTLDADETRPLRWVLVTHREANNYRVPFTITVDTWAP